jgi:hypothetical protein
MICWQGLQMFAGDENNQKRGKRKQLESNVPGKLGRSVLRPYGSMNARETLPGIF